MDHRFWIDGFPPSEPRVPAAGYRVDVGGPAAVGAITIARLGGKAAFVGRLGRDETGEYIKTVLAAEGVDVQHLRSFESARTPVSSILVTPEGERYIFAYHGEGIPADPGWIGPAFLENARALLIDHTWPAGAACLAAEARRRRLPVVLDLHRSTDACWRLAGLATHVIGDEGLAASLGGVEQALARISRGGAWGAVTRGAAGVVHSGGSVPALRTETVDTTGAGDVFHGAFALALCEGAAEIDALAFATVAAGQRCRLGEIPYRTRVECNELTALS